jgi:hypothetical protein
VQHEREPLCRAERVEHDEQGEADRVGEQCLLLWVGHGPDHRVREVAVEGLLAAGAAGAQHVQADPRDDRGQPAAEVLDVLRAGAAHPQPAVLHRVVRLRQRPEHPVGDRAQVRAVLLEPGREPLVLVHVSHLPLAGCQNS